MRHLHYYRVSARTHYELGYKLGKLFKSPSLDTYHAILKRFTFHTALLADSQKYLAITEQFFPAYIEELKGYAKGIGVDFASYWLVFLNEELDLYPEKCTSIYTNNGLLIGHNEDFDDHFKKRICLVEKKVGDNTILELYYYNSLGGTACSVNSHGFVQTINTLHHTDERLGVPRNIIARWLSETENPDKDYEKMKTMMRSLGYSHTFTSLSGNVINIESSANASHISHVGTPYIHTNHFLTDLKIYEANTGPNGNSHERYAKAAAGAKSAMTVPQMQNLLADVMTLTSNKLRASETIARVVIDLEEKNWWCWLAREKERGWVRYPIRFL